MVARQHADLALASVLSHSRLAVQQINVPPFSFPFTIENITFSCIARHLDVQKPLDLARGFGQNIRLMTFTDPASHAHDTEYIAYLASHSVNVSPSDVPLKTVPLARTGSTGYS